MAIAKVFQCGNSQAVRLPKEFQFHSKEVEIFRKGDSLILREKPKNLTKAFDILSEMPKSFSRNKRKDSLPQVREDF